MKNILNKLKINSFTYYFLILCFFCGFIKNVLILYFIVIIHELGHIIIIKIFKYEITKIELYPFGGITTVNKLINSSIYKDLIISISGVLFQYIIISLLIKLNIFSLNSIEIIRNYNKIIFIFNLLPIIPLDGSKILENILNKIFSYKKSYFLNFIISFIFILIFINYNIIFSLNNYLIIGVLIFNTIKYFKDFKYNFNKFLLERLIYDLPYKKIVNNTKYIGDLKKEKLHYFKKSDQYIHEKTKIQKKFDKNTYF